MGTGMVLVLGLASIFFFSALLIAAALMMRGQWDRLGQSGRSGESRERPKE